jgi:hypothetical protein
LGKITAIYYTANIIPQTFAENIRQQILSAIGDMPLISVSQKPVDFGENICVGNIGQTHLNIYRQMLIGAKAAQTDYVAMCEDDTLYTPEHFTSFLPDLDTFAYDINRWRLYTWRSFFSYTERVVASMMIAPRKKLVEALEERFEKYPDPDNTPCRNFCEPGRRERKLGVAYQKLVRFKSKGPPCIVFTHRQCLGFNRLGKRKALGPVIKDYLNFWGTTKDVKKYYYESGR